MSSATLRSVQRAVAVEAQSWRRVGSRPALWRRDVVAASRFALWQISLSNTELQGLLILQICKDSSPAGRGQSGLRSAPLLEPVRGSTTLRSVALGRVKTRCWPVLDGDGGVSALQPELELGQQGSLCHWHRLLALAGPCCPPRRASTHASRLARFARRWPRCSFSLNSAASMQWCSQQPILQSNCLIQTACIRLHMHDFTLIKL